MANGNSNNGCGCLVLLALFGICSLVANLCSGNKENKPIADSYQSRQNVYGNPTSPNVVSEPELSEEDKKFLDNSLTTGSTPYAEFYGENAVRPYSDYCGIRVTAPKESDIVVIIKRNNSRGFVISHGYIRAGDSYQFDLPNGTYQTFFYYGEGWNPNKEMAGGVRGGFVKDEIYSKDEPQEIYDAVLSYVLQLQRDGNFRTKGSNANEVF